MIQVFLSNSEFVEPDQKQPALPDGQEKRRHTRHRFSQSLEIVRGDDEFEAMTFEISEGGLSAATANVLRIGEHVELHPVLGYRLAAIIRNKTGAMYGFEFAGLTDEQRETIRAKCRSLPVFVSLNDEH